MEPTQRPLRITEVHHRLRSKLSLKLKGNSQFQGFQDLTGIRGGLEVTGQLVGGAEPLDTRCCGCAPRWRVIAPETIPILGFTVLSKYDSLSNPHGVIQIQGARSVAIELVEPVEQPVIMRQLLHRQTLVANVDEILSALFGRIQPPFLRIVCIDANQSEQSFTGGVPRHNPSVLALRVGDLEYELSAVVLEGPQGSTPGNEISEVFPIARYLYIFGQRHGCQPISP